MRCRHLGRGLLGDPVRDGGGQVLHMGRTTQTPGGGGQCTQARCSESTQPRDLIPECPSKMKAHTQRDGQVLSHLHHPARCIADGAIVVDVEVLQRLHEASAHVPEPGGLCRGGGSVAKGDGASEGCVLCRGVWCKSARGPMCVVQERKGSHVCDGGGAGLYSCTFPHNQQAPQAHPVSAVFTAVSTRPSLPAIVWKKNSVGVRPL
jgi:hypothetical protein